MQTRDEVEGLHKCRGSLDVSNAQIMGYNFKNNKKKNIKLVVRLPFFLLRLKTLINTETIRQFEKQGEYEFYLWKKSERSGNFTGPKANFKVKTC